MGRRRVPRRARRAARATTPAGRRRSPSATGSPSGSGCGCCSSARTSTTPARTRSTTCSARRCSPSAWASDALVAETGAGQHGVATATAAALLRHGVHRVHGRGRHGPPGAQRVPHAAARRRGACPSPRQPHAQGRGQRGDARLGGHRRDDALLPRLGDGPAPVPVDGARAPPGHRRRGPRSSAARCSTAPTPTWSSPASAAARTRPASSPASSTPTGSSSWSASSRPAARPSAAACPASCTACARYLMQDESARCSRRSRSRPASTTRASAPSTRTSPPIGRARYEAVTDAEVIDAFQLLSRDRGDHPRARAGPRAGVGRREARAALAGHDGARQPVGRGDKDVAQIDATSWAASSVTARSRSALRDRARRRAASCSCRTSPAASTTSWLDVVARRRRRRRRRDRDRHPVLRPGDGRSGHPGGRRSGRSRRAPRRRRSSTTLPTLDAGVPARRDDLLQHRRSASGHRALRRRARRRRRRRGASCPTSRSRRSARGPRRPTPPASRPCCSPRPRRPTSACRAICAAPAGFVYAVGLLGVTGERDSLADSAVVIAARLKAVTDMPVLVGVGVSNAEPGGRGRASSPTAWSSARALVRRLLDGGGPDAAGEFVAELRAALDERWPPRSAP